MSTADRKPPLAVLDPLAQYGCGPIQFSGTDNTFYERRLIFDKIIEPSAATLRDQFEIFALSVRDVLSQRWVLTTRTYAQRNPKRIYYLSMEYLLGRSLANNVMNLLLRNGGRGHGHTERDRLAQRAGIGTRSRAWQRRSRTACGMFPRLDGDAAAASHGLRTALRVRHVHAVDSEWLAAGTAGSLATTSRPLGSGATR